ncbi:hypothetical protein BCV70DRAFT_217026 [Testicularia cyperi]|uniref:Uncharacterized protein n=1 Tax=Testicularia cyperi TaxID=1882483 RepID=A0A317XNU4_9BASI|nr:hypothetical protein BCV70DRAFT_217026 [Testicularia cyperi]
MPPRRSSRRLAGGAPSSDVAGRSGTPSVDVDARLNNENAPAARDVGTRYAKSATEKSLPSSTRSSTPRTPLTDRNVPSRLRISTEKGLATATSTRKASTAHPAHPNEQTRSRRLGPARKATSSRGVADIGTASTSAKSSGRHFAVHSSERELELFTHVEIPAVAPRDETVLDESATAAPFSGKTAPPANSGRVSRPRKEPVSTQTLASVTDSEENKPLPTTRQRARGSPGRTSRKPVAAKSASPRPPMSASISSHSSADDKENVPPTGAVLDSQLGTLHRGAAGRRSPSSSALQLQRGFGHRHDLTSSDPIPLHSTPLVSHRKSSGRPKMRSGTPSRAALQELQVQPSLDELFPVSSHSDSLDSPGVGRRSSAVPASDSKLQEYQDLGVLKVRAWKAAGNGGQDIEPLSPLGSTESHDVADLSASVPRHVEAEGGVTAFVEVPASGDHSEELAYSAPRDDDDDEFGFLMAERKVKRQRNRASSLLSNMATPPVSATRPAGCVDDLDDDLYIDDLPEPIHTSEDVRLAEFAFHMSSSPPLAAPPGEVVPPASQKATKLVTPPSPSPVDTESERPNAEEESTGRVTRSRSRTQRLGDATAVTPKDLKDAGDETSMPSLSGLLTSSPTSKRTRSRAASTSKKDQKASKIAGVPLKKKEQEERKVLELLAMSSSSPAPSTSSPSPGFSPQKSRKKLRMDDALALLPSRKPIAHPRSARTKAKAKSAPKSQQKAKPGTFRSVSTRISRKSDTVIEVSDEAEEQSDDQTEHSDNEHDGSDEEAPVISRRSRPRAGTQSKTTLDKGKRRARSPARSSSPSPTDDAVLRATRLKEIAEAANYKLEVEVTL